ncbi:class I SAM-dependent methyltransferase [Subtercola boreus]|uniref:SAM-dependent methyltransferase n=1 Tax=Subtercola boreus TaxID=120213 RepID=A0A3E0WGC5_9MICO|nr:class I SAM-dependent methyltransferase [Subtercola boreus]RFA22745.1 SAM-dependent methyltransferase [Subtercola boreus]RFA23100.1 SAM-dependent methyltransferase [Subtercola boreus]RFA28853.1 SAM-dependent methyltransferase [Subtercola boreus]
MAEFFANAESYDRFMGRFSVPLAKRFIDLVAPALGGSALDVGCGPGAVTGELVDALGADRVSAVDPSEPFVQAARSRFPGVDIRVAAADSLPFPDHTFDLTLAQLVVHFMTDPVAGIREMARVTRPGGTIAANVWDFSGTRGPLGVFDRAVLDLDPSAPITEITKGTADGDLAAVFADAGLTDSAAGELTVSVLFPSFADWWDPFTLGIGPAGAYVAALDAPRRERLRHQAAELLPDGPFTIRATAWTVVGRKPE